MKFSYKYKKLTASLLVIILLVNLLSFYTFAETNTPEANALEEVTMDDTLRTSGKVENTYNKIHFYVGDEDYAVIDDMTELKAATSELSEVSSIAAANAARSGTAAEEYQITVQFASDFMETDEYKAFSEERSELDSIEEVREFRSRVNAFSKEYHEALVQKNIASLSALEGEEINAVDYSPFVVVIVDPATIDADTLVAFAASESIANVSVGQTAKPAESASWNNTLRGINAYDIVSNSTYTGEGIRIGIYEAAGNCFTEIEELVGKNITVRDPGQGISPHGTAVTSVLALMAPDAEFYYSHEVEGEIGIGWFISNNCDIVNMSGNYYQGQYQGSDRYAVGPRQYRYDIDAVFDYQIRANFVTAVISAGNLCTDNSSVKYNPDNKVVSPGYAYNAITVGGVNYQNILFNTLVHDESASYVSIKPQVKPNVSAVFEVNLPTLGVFDGTSAAAPQVTGCIALLMESNVSYCIYPERVMSVVTSAAQKTADYTANVGQFDSRVGAGVIDLQKMLNNGTKYRIEYRYAGSASSDFLTLELNLTAGMNFQAALAWMSYPVNASTTGISISQVILTDYDLRIYSPSNQLYASQLGDSNVEMVRFTVEETGTYRIVLRQYGNKSDDSGDDTVVLSYNF